MLLMQLNPNIAKLQTTQFISTLFDNQNNPKFAELFDNTLLNIAKENQTTAAGGPFSSVS
jgi:type I restriction enzyme M protein